MRTHLVQLELPTWGGRRASAGRKRRSPLPLVSHKKRPAHSARFPLHAVLRSAVAGLRRRELFEAIQSALRAGSNRFGFRLIHFSVQGNHLHLIIEAVDTASMSRGMQGLMVRIARAINRASRRRGKVFADHYFARELQTPAEVRRAVRYVLDNNMVHASAETRTDPCAARAPLVAPRTWLRGIGWLR